MNLKVGDLIFVTDEDLKGTVSSFDKVSVTLTCEDGFDYSFPIEKIFKINDEGHVERTSGYPRIDIRPRKIKVDQSESVFLDMQSGIIDLHLEVLVPQRYFSSDYEALSFQLEVVREVIFQANRKRIRKITFVHGVGKGKLRKELRNLLEDSYPEIEYLDGSYQKFGGGATEIIIHQFDS